MPGDFVNIWVPALSFEKPARFGSDFLTANSCIGDTVWQAFEQ
jgi:hypothetical protein